MWCKEGDALLVCTIFGKNMIGLRKFFLPALPLEPEKEKHPAGIQPDVRVYQNLEAMDTRFLVILQSYPVFKNGNFPKAELFVMGFLHTRSYIKNIVEKLLAQLVHRFIFH